MSKKSTFCGNRILRSNLIAQERESMCVLERVCIFHKLNSCKINYTRLLMQKSLCPPHCFTLTFWNNRNCTQQFTTASFDALVVIACFAHIQCKTSNWFNIHAEANVQEIVGKILPRNIHMHSNCNEIGGDAVGSFFTMYDRINKIRINRKSEAKEKR